jgi:hypothetical protein
MFKFNYSLLLMQLSCEPSRDISTIPDKDYERKHAVLQISKFVCI